MILNLKVDGQTLTLPEDSLGMVEKTLNYVKCVFDFTSEEWNETIKTAYFRNEKTGETASKILQNNECMIPHEVLEDEGYVSFSVVGEKENYRITSSAVSFFNNPTVYGGEPSDPTPTEYEQIIALSLETMEIAQQVRTDADNGKFNGATGATGPQGPPGKDAVTDTELSTDSDNAIANSTVSKVLAYGNLIGFEKIDSYEEFEEFNAKYPVDVSEDDFLVLYITSDLSYSDINGSFDCPPGLYVITADNFFRLCPDTESVNSHFENIDEMMNSWYTVVDLKANKYELDAVKTNLDNVSDTADEALTVARGRNRALCFFTKQELDSWLNGEFQREDGKTKADLQVGDNLYIVEVGVPDYWWDGEQVRPLETQKVDLSEYAEKEYVDKKVEQEVSVPNNEIANYLEVADILGIWKNATAGRTSFANLFENSNVKTIPLIDTSSGTTFTRMFKNCAKLENIPFLDMSKAINMFNMFNDCTSLTSFRGYDTSKVTNFNGTFMNCSAIEVIEIDTSSATAVSYLFSGCSALTSVKTLDFSKVTQQDNVFRSCANLVHIEFVPESIKLSISLLACPLLDSDSVASIFEGLADLTDTETQTLTLHKDVQITQVQADGAVAKNWNIVGGTVNG